MFANCLRDPSLNHGGNRTERPLVGSKMCISTCAFPSLAEKAVVIFEGHSSSESFDNTVFTLLHPPQKMFPWPVTVFLLAPAARWPRRQEFFAEIPPIQMEAGPFEWTATCEISPNGQRLRRRCTALICLFLSLLCMAGGFPLQPAQVDRCPSTSFRAREPADRWTWKPCVRACVRSSCLASDPLALPSIALAAPGLCARFSRDESGKFVAGDGYEFSSPSGERHTGIKTDYLTLL